MTNSFGVKSFTLHTVLQDDERQKENAGKFMTPTKVHLQIFDDMHVSTAFSFTNSAKCAYRTIAEFVKHVTNHSADHFQHSSFRKHHRPPQVSINSESPNTENGDSKEQKSDTQLYGDNATSVVDEVTHGETNKLDENLTDSEMWLCVADGEEAMIRERVDIRGKSRPMEPRHKIPALQLHTEQIGLLKEAPTRRWLCGQEEWNKKYQSSAERAARKQKKLERRVQRLLENARDQGLILESEKGTPVRPKLNGKSNSAHEFDDVGWWGPLDLEDERPPPAAIAKRRDIYEAIALLKATIYHTAPVTHKTIPKRKTSDAIRAVFDPNDSPIGHPKQSVSELQVQANIIPMHGLRLWDVLIG